jgi:hypothetical protein
MAAAFAAAGVTAADAAEDVPVREARPAGARAAVVAPAVAPGVESADASPGDSGVPPEDAAETGADVLTPERASTSASVRLDPQPAVASASATAAAHSCDRRIGSMSSPP